MSDERASPGPFMIDPELYDDTELGSEIRAAHARGCTVAMLIAMRCPTCLRSVRAQELCPVCGEEET